MAAQKYDGYTALILAGGHARRFKGRHKPLAQLWGKTLLEHQLEVLEPLFKDILLITNDPEPFQAYRTIRIKPDIIPDMGPLGGIHSGLHHTRQPCLFVVAGDMPFIQKNVIRQQIQRSRQYPDQVILPRKGTKIEPLHAIYPKTVQRALEKIIQTSSDRSIRTFISHIAHHYWDVQNDTPFININTHEALTRYKAFSNHKDQKR